MTAPSDAQRLAFEHGFGRETIDTERKRALALAVAVGTLGVVLWVTAGTVGGLSPEERRIMRLTPLAFTSYEAAVFAWLTWRQRRGGRVGLRFQTLNLAIELTACSVHILVVAAAGTPLVALTGVPALGYTVFVALTALALDWRLPILGGIVSALQYGVIAWMLYPTLVANIHATTGDLAPAHLLVRPFSYVGIGFAVAFVAHEIKRRTLATLAEVDERKRVLDLFGQQVSPEVADKLLEQASGAGLASETRHVCVLFLDIRGFTSFTEMRSPEEVVDYLNTLFDSMIEAINRNHGIINKFLGDGFMAVFGAPLSDGQDVLNALCAAQELLVGVEQMERAGRIPRTRIGIGLHAGPAVTGNVGSHKRREYTIIGDVVNTAARIEALNKHFDSRILVSDAVWAVAEEAGLTGEAMEPIQVKGRTEPVRVYKMA